MSEEHQEATMTPSMLGLFICAECGYELLTPYVYTNLTMYHIRESGKHLVTFVAEDVWTKRAAR